LRRGMQAGAPEFDPVVAPYTSQLLHFSELHLPPISGSAMGGGRQMPVGQAQQGRGAGGAGQFSGVAGRRMKTAVDVVEYCRLVLAAQGVAAEVGDGGEFTDADRDRSGAVKEPSSLQYQKSPTIER